MFCEIVVYHSKPVDGATLASRLRSASLGPELTVANAYARSSVYRGDDPYGSLFAHDASQHCFVILQKFNRAQSTFHLEGDPNVTGKTLLEVTEEYARTLHEVLRAATCPRGYRVSRLVVRPFEDNFEESGFEGSLFTPAQAYKDVNFWHETRSKLATFLTTFFLVRLGLTTETTKAAALSFVIAAVFLVAELTFRWWGNRGSISWKRR